MRGPVQSRGRSRQAGTEPEPKHRASLVKLLVRDLASGRVVLVGEAVVLGRLLVGLLLERRWESVRNPSDATGSRTASGAASFQTTPWGPLGARPRMTR